MECDVLVSLGIIVQEVYRLLSIVVVEFREYGSIMEVMYDLPSVFDKFFSEKISLVPVKVYYFLKFFLSKHKSSSLLSTRIAQYSHCFCFQLY